MLAAAAASAQTRAARTVAAPPDVAAPPANAIKTASGLATRVITPGKGTDHPDQGRRGHRPLHRVEDRRHDVRQLGDAEASRRAFRVNRVIAGFGEGLQLMVVGEKRRLWIPEALAYKGAREPKGMLVFDIELIDIPTRAPADVKAPPADAKKTASGLAYKVLKEGVGGRHPRVEQRGDGPLHRLDDRRQDVRQLGGPRPAGDVLSSTASSPAGPRACS